MTRCPFLLGFISKEVGKVILHDLDLAELDLRDDAVQPFRGNALCDMERKEAKRALPTTEERQLDAKQCLDEL